ncbi:MAG: tRNA pseudouridine(38-40) synthase TruA [Rhodospirillaceae bacterium]
MPRYKLTIEYDGTDFVGWQRQDNGFGVQQAVEEAVSAFSGDVQTVQAAGRTDAGVHAAGQVAHVDLTRDWEADKVRDALNFHLKGHAVTILEARRMDDDFHARFSATKRYYRYRILNRRPQPALDAGQVWWVPTALDADAMAGAARVLVGHHDFTSFRAARCQAQSPVKTLDRLDVSRAGDEIHVYAEALSFLHHQVRNMVGSLAWVGQGKWTKSHIKQALDARDRAAGGPTAPAEGLCLMAVAYDPPKQEG